MDDLNQALQDILGTEEGQEKLKELTQMLSSGDGGIDMSVLSGLLGGDSPSKEDSNPGKEESEDPGFDIGMILKAKKIMEGASGRDKNADLIRALKPLLRPERQKKADSAIKILKLISIWPMLKESGLLDDFLF